MNSIKIELPVLVQNIEVEGVKQYYLKPLFLPHPIATHRRYERAVAKFQNELRQMFKGFTASRENVEDLLWYRFNPKVEYKVYSMEFLMSKTYIKGDFGVAHFMLNDLCFVCLPSFNNYFFIANKDDKGKYNIMAEAARVIQHFLREERKSEGYVNPENYYASKGEFVSYVSVYVQISDGKFGFEEDAFSFFFSNFSNETDFNGEIEIEKVGYDLNAKYPSEIKRAYYRDETVQRISNIIYSQDNSPIVIVGRDGVGKHSVLHEAVYQYVDLYSTKTKHANQLEKVWHIDPTRIISGMSIVGMWQKRFESILNFVLNRRKEEKFRKDHTDKIVIDNVVSMLRIGKSSQNDMTLSDVIKPYLEQRQIQFILIATPEEWKVLQEKDRRFADLFQVIRIEEPDLETAAKMVFKQRILLEIEHACQIGGPAIAQLFSIHRNYLKSQELPGGVMKILRQLAIKYKLQAVDVDEVRQEFETLSGLGKDIFDEHYIFEEDEVRDRINAQLIGQPDAVDSLTDIVHMIKAKLNTPGKPLSSFMFIGPTGVGKTQAAKVLCKYLMGNEDHMMRFDMNEYIDDYAVDRLIGDYYNPEGQLTGKVRYKPFGILLLDEIEKANPKVHDLLLQVLDDGRLSDSLGRTVDFSNTIIIMTSNIGAKEVDSVLGFKSEHSDDSAIYRKEMENHFRPEFLNRIDKVVIFKPLELLHMYSIARLQINELLRRDGFVRRATMLNIDPDALKWVADRGFNKRMGGRALKRQIERDLTSLSAEQLISTQTDRPIIFEILFKNNQLFPNVIPLDFVDAYQENWLPDLPSEKQGRRFYGHLLRMIEGIESELYQFEREQGFGEDVDDYKTYSFGGEDDLNKKDKDYVDDSNWMYYQFKDRVSELKERIKDTLLGFQNKYYVSSPVIPLRLKRVGFLNDGNSVHRRSMMDKLFQEAAMDDLSDTYRFNATEFDRLNTQFLDHWLDVALLRLYFNGLLSQSIDVLEIGFHSYIAGLGDKEIDFLIGRYKEMFHGLDLFYHFNKEEKTFLLEGYGLNELLKGEDGIHLFYIPHQNPLPIRVSVKNEEDKAKDKMLKVIRLYNGTNTITDLRTNYTNAGNISSSEFKFLLYGGLDQQIRSGLTN